jgi:hypothetical protein
VQELAVHKLRDGRVELLFDHHIERKGSQNAFNRSGPVGLGRKNLDPLRYKRQICFVEAK